METQFDFLQLHRMGIDTHQEPVVYMRRDCHVATSEGFNAMSRIRVNTAQTSIIATLVLVCSDLLSHQQAGLSEAAWRLLHCPVDGESAWFHLNLNDRQHKPSRTLQAGYRCNDLREYQ